MNIYYLGPDGSYSYTLVHKMFDTNVQFVACKSFRDILTQTQNDIEGIGVLAIENSISSTVHQTVDLLYNSDVCIVGEASMRIQMDLIGIKGSSLDAIKTLYSHPQALAQCSEFIRSHTISTHEMSSTSAAVDFVLEKNDPAAAAIGNIETIDSTNLTVLKEQIANVPHNMTRWVCIAREGIASIGKRIDKCTYIFTVKHQPGSLVEVLASIAKLKCNLTKIESRPLPGTDWEYGFWIDIEIPESTQMSFDAMMKESTLECRCVGAYERGILFDQ